MLEEQEQHVAYDTELKHLEEGYEGQLTGYQESDPQKQAILDEIAPKLQMARAHANDLRERNSGQLPQDDPQLDELLEDVRESFKRLDLRTSNGGPPLA